MKDVFLFIYKEIIPPIAVGYLIANIIILIVDIIIGVK